MSTKSVKITNGKILNYKISASGYKTIYGSQVITADTTINKNMIAENDPNGVYSLGDRIGNIATFVDYFNTKDPETNIEKTYAVFVLDAAYRSYLASASTAGDSLVIPNLPTYTGSDSKTATESATFNCNCYLAVENVTWRIINNARNISVTIGNDTYYGQIPTIPQLFRIRELGSQLDAKDPTLSDYSSNSLETWWSGTYGVCSSTGGQYQGYNRFLFIAKSTNTPSIAYLNSAMIMLPIFEIPVE